MDFGLKTSIFCETHGQIVADSQSCVRPPSHPGEQGGGGGLTTQLKVHQHNCSHRRIKEMTKKGSVLGGKLENSI